MVRRIVIGLIVFIIAIGGWYAYKRWHGNSHNTTGEIFSDDLTPGSVSRSGEVSTATAASRSNTPANSSPLTVPASDSLPANAPDGQRFSGSGQYQVYRQGNITWRIDTQTGQSCILFATPEEWRKPLVYSHGCNAT